MKRWNWLFVLIVLTLLGALPSQTSAQSAPDAVDAVIVVGGNISSNTTWTTGNVYYATSNVTILSGVTLTLQPGVIVKLQSGRELIVEGKITAIGSSSQPVIFTSYRDDSAGGDTNGDGSSVGQRGDWDWIEFRASSDDTSVLDRVEVRYGGHWGYNEEANIRLLDASPTIRNSVISYSYGHGIYLSSNLSAGSSAPAISNNQFSNNRLASIGSDVASWPTLSGNNSLNNGTNGLALFGGSISANTQWNQTSMVYRVFGDITVSSGATLSVAPGMIVKLNSGQELYIDGKLMAVGAQGQPAIFTSYRDDSAGGDTNGDGSSVGQRGDWNWIEFRAGSDDASVLDRVEVRYGGSCCYDDRANIRLLDASPAIRNSVISYSGRHGIYVQNSTPQLVCNDIVNNQTLGLRNNTPNIVVGAHNQYWGSASGPRHPTLNPNGQGNGVSDGIDFIPWSSVPCNSSVFRVMFPYILVR